MAEFEEYLRDPMSAGLFAAVCTAAYIHIKAKVNNEGQQPLNAYAKPAMLNFLMVYFIVSNGLGVKETISTEPF
jgi:hypothetical protein